eukprot:57909-Chlamydomonas_euryale.AAC.2
MVCLKEQLLAQHIDAAGATAACARAWRKRHARRRSALRRRVLRRWARGFQCVLRRRGRRNVHVRGAFFESALEADARLVDE